MIKPTTLPAAHPFEVYISKPEGMTDDHWMTEAMRMLSDPTHVITSRPWFTKFAQIANDRYDLLVEAEKLVKDKAWLARWKALKEAS